MIYLIQGYGNVGKLLKIGYTNNLDFRLSMFKTDTPDFKLLATREGDEGFENKLHKYFSRFRYNHDNYYGREWFYYDERIIEEFKTLQEENLISLKKLRSKMESILDISELISDRLNSIALSSVVGDVTVTRKRAMIDRLWKLNSKLVIPDDCPEAIDMTKTIISLGNKNRFNLHSLVNGFFANVVGPYEVELSICNNLPGSLDKSEYLLEERAFEVIYSYYLDRISKDFGKNYSRELKIRSTYSDFFKEYDKIELRPDKLKFLCEYSFAGNDLSDILVAVHEKGFRKFITILGPEVCRACGYNVTKLYNRLDIASFEPSKLKERVLSEFEVGKSYTRAFIKVRLGEVYADLGYKATPKAIDLGKYFRVKSRLLSKGGKRVHGLEILSKRDQ